VKARQRTVVLDGTFSIEEIKVKGSSRRKTARATKNKNKAANAKRTARRKAGQKPPAVKLGPVVLASRLNIKNIAELKESLLAAYDADSTVVVDAGAVESIDTAALQLLVAFASSRRERSRAVEWHQPSSVFCEAAKMLDLRVPLGIGAGDVTKEDDGLLPVF